MKTIACSVALCAALAFRPAFADVAPGSSPQPLQELLGNPRFGLEWSQFARRAFPLNDIPAGARLRAARQVRRLAGARSVGSLPGTWVNIGPLPLSDGGTITSGRTKAIAVDPWNSTHWLIGTAQGGVWETFNAGTTWAAKTDDQDSLAIGAVAFAPSNPNIVYAGTGEAGFTGDSYAGAGLLKSTDGGATWSLLATPTFDKASFSDIKVDPVNPNVLLAATTGGLAGRGETLLAPPLPQRGLFKSTDGGQTWARTFNPPSFDCTSTVVTLCTEATDLEVDPTNFKHQYAGIGFPIVESATGTPNGLYRSTNGGDSWALINGPWSTMAEGVGRVEIAIAPSDPNTMYVGIQDAFNYASGVSTPVGVDGALLGLWKTTNAWAASPTFTPIDTSATGPWGYCSLYSPPVFERQCHYDHDLSVDPTDSNVLYAGGVPLWKYDGVSWTDVTNGIHVDQQAMAWSGNRLIVVNDGGVWSTTDGGSTWTSHNASLSTIQFYNGSTHPTDPRFALGGSQDNGTEEWDGQATWHEIVFDSDGTPSAISTSQARTHWAASSQNLNILRTVDGGAHFTAADGGIDHTNAPFAAQFAKCPSNDDIFIAGTDNLWRSDNFFSAPPPSWTTNGPEMGLVTHPLLGTSIGLTAMAFASSDATCGTYAYAANGSELRLTSDGGAHWTDIDAGDAVPDRYMTDLAFDPSDASVLYVTLSGFDESTPGHAGHVFKTTNALSPSPSWTNVSPPVNIPHNTIAIDPRDSNHLYVGTDIGVWTSANGGGSWTHMGPESGMPNVAVFDIQTTANGRPMAFTHGRGAFILSGGLGAYVTNFNDNTVSVIDTNAEPPVVAATIPVGNGPWGVAVHPAGALVYITNRSAGTVSVIDTATNSVSATIPVGGSPTGVAVNGAGTLAYVSNFADNTVSVIDVASQTVLHVVSVGAGPYGVVVNPTGTKVYVANQSDDTVSVIDTLIDAVTATVNVNPHPTGIAVNPTGTRVYAVSDGTDYSYLTVIDTGDNTPIPTIAPVEGPGVAVNAAGTRLYASDRADNQLEVVDLTVEPPTVMFQETFFPASVGTPVGVAVNTTATRLFFANQNDGLVSIFDSTIEHPGYEFLTSVPVGSGATAFGQFLQNNTGAGLEAGEGTCTLTPLNLGPGLYGFTGNLTFAPGGFNVFGTPVDLASQVGSMSFTAQVANFQGVVGTLTGTLSSIPLAFSVNGTFLDGFHPQFVGDISNITGTVLPPGILYTLEGGPFTLGPTLTGPCRLNAFLVANTPVGASVSITSDIKLTPSLNLPIEVTYQQVVSPGTTTIKASTTTVTTPPSHFSVDLPQGHVSFDISTTAAVGGQITVCVQFPSTTDPAVASHFVILHQEGNSVVDRTVQPVDIANSRVCAHVISLSPFVLARTVSNGLIPPDKNVRRCEQGVRAHLATLLSGIDKCNGQTASKTFAGLGFDEATCEATARSAYDSANGQLHACPACVVSNEPTLRDQGETVVDQMRQLIFCAGTTSLPGDLNGFVPPDANALHCESSLGGLARTLGKKVATCHKKAADKALSGLSFDEAACAAGARAAFDAHVAALKHCPPCVAKNAAALADTISGFVNGAAEQIYCAGSTSIP